MMNKQSRPFGRLCFDSRCQEVLNLKKFVSKVSIDKGWSGDKKYCVTDETGTHYLLRISPVERKARVEKTFEQMRRVATLGIPMCQPIECGTCEEGVYVLHTWVDGTDAEEMLAGMPEDRQYAYGMDAGHILQKIHTIPASKGEHNWEEYFNHKIERKIIQYNDCPLKYPGGEMLVSYIEKNRHLLAGQSVTYQHGDFHIGNMMIDREGRLVIIDFDKDDIGDPWEEFNRIVWCAQAAPAFARGMVDGYFGGDVPEKFWRLLALYIANNTIGSLPWAIPFGQREIDVMLKQGRDVLQWYDGMKEYIPLWYREK